MNILGIFVLKFSNYTVVPQFIQTKRLKKNKIRLKCFESASDCQFFFFFCNIPKGSENPEQSLYTGKIEENRTYIFTHLFASVTTQWPQRGTASWSAASEILYVMQFEKTKYACHVIDNDRQLILHNLYSIWFVLKYYLTG